MNCHIHLALNIYCIHHSSLRNRYIICLATVMNLIICNKSEIWEIINLFSCLLSFYIHLLILMFASLSTFRVHLIVSVTVALVNYHQKKKKNSWRNIKLHANKLFIQGNNIKLELGKQMCTLKVKALGQTLPYANAKKYNYGLNYE